MSYVESPTETLKKFDKTPGWREEPVEVLAGDFFSMGNESSYLWNPYFYEERNGNLFDPNRQRQIAGTANGDKVEEGVNKQLEDWFLSHESGLGVWISPRGYGVRPYAEEQITIYRIAYKFDGTKVLLCTSHQFKANFQNPEDLRRFIFTEDDKEESIFEIIDWLKNISQEKIGASVENSNARKKQAEYYARRYKSGIPMSQIAYEMTQTRLLGEHPIGCGSNTTFTESPSFDKTSTLTPIINFEGWHGGTCIICGESTWVGPCDICAPCASKM